MKIWLKMLVMPLSIAAMTGCEGADVDGAFALLTKAWSESYSKLATTDGRLSAAGDGIIPEKYSRNGGNINPDMQWENAPEGTKSFVLIMDDPDALPTYVHWNVFLKDATISKIEEGASTNGTMPTNAVEGTTDGGLTHYEGPNPPVRHTYHFCVYAMSSEGLPDGVTAASKFTRSDFKTNYKDNIIEEACLQGAYGDL